MRRHPARLALAAVAVATAFLWFAAPAGAHSALEASTPTSGETVERSPGSLTLRFNEPVDLPDGSVRLLDVDGEPVGIGAPTAVDTLVSAELPELADGSYVVAWKVMSADSHPVSGAFTFAVGAPSLSTTDAEALAESAAAESTDPAARVLADAASGLVYAGVLLAFGAGAFGVLVLGDRSREADALVRVGVVVGKVGLLLAIPAEAVLVRGRVEWPRLDALGDQLSGPVGAQAVLGILGLAMVWSTTRMRRRADRAVFVVDGALLAFAGLAVLGHTRTATPTWLAVTADIAHLAAAAVWTGGVAALLWTLRLRRGGDGDDSSVAIVARFSALASASIVVVAAAGTLLGWRIVGSWGGLVSTYGALLGVKVALFGVIAAIGAHNHFRLVGVAADGRLRRTLALEGAVMLAVLAITSVLTSTSPNEDATDDPNSSSLTCSEVATMESMPGMEDMDHSCVGTTTTSIVPFDPTDAPTASTSLPDAGAPTTRPAPIGAATGASASDDFGDGLARITVAPATVGDNLVSIQLTDADGGALDPAEPPSVEFRLREQDIGPIVAEAERVGPGAYRVRQDLVLPGTWEVNVSAVVSDFEQPQAIIEVDVGR